MASQKAVLARIHQAAIQLFAEHGLSHVNVRELAITAGVARGTIYNNLPDTDVLFTEVAAQLASDMNERVTRCFQGIEDPAERLAIGIGLYAKRAHDEPHWGRFINRFAFSYAALKDIWAGPPMQDLLIGMQSGRYTVREDQIPSAMGMMAAAVLGAIFLVLEGHRGWPDAAAQAAELVLVSLGLAPQEARHLARVARVPPGMQETVD